MSKITFITTAAFLTIFTLFSFGQGTIRGKVTDATTGDIVFGVRIETSANGTPKRTKTDFDGLYSLPIPAGTYTIKFSQKTEGYIDQEQTVTVTDGNVTELNVQLATSIQQVDGVEVVYVKTTGGSDEAIDKAKREAVGATDGTGSQKMNEQGQSDAADAAKSVTGLSVVGKVVYVRGLGDRYTKTILNSMEIPGLDPDRNAVQLDIFPTTVIDKITVYKTFVPNLAGDFTGGLVDIITKDFPTERTMYFKGGLGYNTQATFNSNYIGYKGSPLDVLGFGAGARKLPFSKLTQIPDPTSGDQGLTTLTSLFDPVMAAEPKGNFLNQSYAFSLGNQFNNLGKDSLDYGYNFVLNYRNSHNFYETAQFNEYRKDQEASETQLFADRTSQGAVAENDVLLTALLGQSLKFKKNSKLSFTLFHIQNGNSSTSRVRQNNFESNPGILEKTSLQYTRRSVSNANISGVHIFDKWRYDWKVTPTYSRISDPDLRSTVLEILEDPGPNGEDVYSFTPAVGSEIRRIYRDLTEFNASGRFDATYKFKMDTAAKSKRVSKIKVGAMNTYKTRSFDIYDLNFRPEKLTTFSSDPNWYFQEENIWTPEKDSGIYVTGQTEPANNFNASINVAGAYIMNELPITEAFKATYGVRAEHALYKYTGQNNSATQIFNDSIVLNQLSILPSVNLVYKIEKKADSVHYARYTNFRAAYTQTVARPSFKEKSIAQIYDPIQGRRYNGNIDLLQTRVHNADLRWEYFFGRTELVSASAFYKRFINPIEIVAFDVAPSEVKPVNAGVADVYGAELELRKAVGFNKKGKEHLNLVLGSNFTYIVSRINMNQVMLNKGTELVSEKSLREENAREGEVISDYRPMFGQSPYIVNGFVTFRNDSLGLVMNLSYNVQGKRLAVIGVGKLPDVYEQPFHSLNLKVSKTFGEDNRWKGSLSAQNLLMNARRRSYESFGDTGEIDDRLYDYFYQGMTISGSIAFKITGKKVKKK